MRKIVGGVFVSLDGVMQAPGGPEEDTTGNFKLGGWVPKFWDKKLDQVMGGFFDKPFDLLLGRRTYEIFAAHWGYLGDSDPTGAQFNQATKYVMTRGDARLDWKNSQRVTGIDELKKIKSTEGPDILIQGSSTIYPALFRAGLIDKLCVMTFPVVLGHGKRLFGEETPPFKMTMTECDNSNSGVVISTYEPSGQIPLGNFQLENPSPAEITRRQLMREENGEP